MNVSQESSISWNISDYTWVCVLNWTEIVEKVYLWLTIENFMVQIYYSDKLISSHIDYSDNSNLRFLQIIICFKTNIFNRHVLMVYIFNTWTDNSFNDLQYKWFKLAEKYKSYLSADIFKIIFFNIMHQRKSKL